MDAQDALPEEAAHISLTLRPSVPMHYLQALPWIAALGLVDALNAQGEADAGILWPHDVQSARFGRLRLRSHGGCDERGMYVSLRVDASQDLRLGPLRDQVLARVGLWERAVALGRSAAGPLAAVLSDYFDACVLMGHQVQACYPNGKPFDQGELAGVDAWGRATLRRADGSLFEVAPEQATLEAVL